MRVKFAILFFIAAPLAAQQPAPVPAPFRVEESTIAQIHDAMKAGRLTCRALVDAYLRRIEAYDKNGPSLNALVGPMESGVIQMRSNGRQVRGDVRQLGNRVRLVKNTDRLLHSDVSVDHRLGRLVLPQYVGRESMN